MKLVIMAVIVVLGLGAGFVSHNILNKIEKTDSEGVQTFHTFHNLPERISEKLTPIDKNNINADQAVEPIDSAATINDDEDKERNTGIIKDDVRSPAATSTAQAANASSSEIIGEINNLPARVAQNSGEICRSVINGKVYIPEASGWTAKRTFATRQKQFFNLQCFEPGTNTPTRHVRRLLFR